MKMKSRIVQLVAATGAMFASSAVYADSISPTTFSATLTVGESTLLRKTVTVSAGTPTSSKVDVFFLADETGSMGSSIAAVKASASSILSTTAGAGDVAFGVGGYRDVGDAWVYRQLNNLTTVQATSQASINSWLASGGGDIPEANMFALQEVANTTTWRAGSERLAVWFGDAPGHDPRNGATEVSATAALVAKGISVLAISLPSGPGLNSTGQALRIATATGGSYFAAPNNAAIVAAINAAISTAFSTYTTVGLDLSDAPAGVAVTATPGYVGTYDRSIERTFAFDVTFTGVTPGTYGFDIFGTVDGGRVATETDRIVVTAAGVPDGGSSLIMLSAAMAGMTLLRRRTQRRV